jgi:hypothetical protein
MRLRTQYFQLLLCLALLTSCASTPNWKGMSEEEISAWREMNVQAGEAQSFRKAGLSTDAVATWHAAGLASSEAILDWNEAGWNAATAGPWLDNQFDLETAIEWSKERFTPSQARAWIDGGFSLREAIANRAKGLAPVR